MIVTKQHIAGLTMAHSDGAVPIGHGLEVMLPTGVQHGDAWEITIEPLKVQQHLANAFLSNDVFVSNSQELLSVLRGNLLQCNNTTDGTFSHPTRPSVPIPNYRSEMLAQHFNHIFLVVGKTLYWTDLDSYWNWYPDHNNEADFREIESQSDDATGLIRVGEMLFLHFPRAIFSVSYVGKPTVVQILERSHGCGAAVPRGLVGHQSVQYFLGLDNFYLFSDSAKPIGTEIWKDFTDNCTDFTTVWAYVDQVNQEICWVSGDTVYAFNYTEGHWTKHSSSGILDHTLSPWRPTFHSIASSSDLIIGESSSILEHDKIGGIENLWVSGDGVVRAARKGDSVSQCVDRPSPFLESDDMNYGDAHYSKSVGLVVFDANYDLPFTGLRVWVARMNSTLAEPQWVDCGVWTKDMVHRDFPVVTAKNLRFRFVVEEPTAGFDGSHQADGSVRFDGSFVPQLQACDVDQKFDDPSVPNFDGSYNTLGRLDYFEIVSWGEKVDLPQKLIGPDK